MTQATPNPFWEDPGIVTRFAERDPDHRLQALLPRYGSPPAVRVLDVGCAGGRNTELLARMGFDVHALDASPPMVDRTRERLVPWVGEAAARARVIQGFMHRLERYADGSFDLVIALGVWHSATSEAEWDGAVREARRVLARGGLVLVANHTAAFDPEGRGLQAVAGSGVLFDGPASGRSTLMEPDVTDRELAVRGFRPWTPTQTVMARTETGRRVTGNGLYVAA